MIKNSSLFSLVDPEGNWISYVGDFDNFPRCGDLMI